MAACAPFLEELIKDYLLFRGYTSTVQALENDSKENKEKGFRPDKITEQMLSMIHRYDLRSLQDYWNYLDTHILCRLEQQYQGSVKKLEQGLYKYYLLHTITTGQSERTLEFFNIMSNSLHDLPEWKDWFALPFLRSPEEMPQFQPYFQKQWQETFLLSLRNFFSVVFQSMPTPALLSYHQEKMRLDALVEENNSLRERVRDEKLSAPLSAPLTSPLMSPLNAELVDDFSALSQDDPTPAPAPVREGGRTEKGVRSLMRSLGGGVPSLSTSPRASRRSAPSMDPGQGKTQTDTDHTTPEPVPPPKVVAGGGNRQVNFQPSQAPASKQTRNSGPPLTGAGGGAVGANAGGVGASGGAVGVGGGVGAGVVPPSSHPGLLLLGEEVYGEHHSSVLQCGFSPNGASLASLDGSGVVKVWACSPTPTTACSIMAKHTINTLHWASSRDRLLLLGTNNGTIRVFDTLEKKNLYEAAVDPMFPRVIGLSASPAGSQFVCSSISESKVRNIQGKLTQWDMKSMRTLTDLPIAPTPITVNSCSYNHNGQLLLAGGSDGRLRLFDMRAVECIASWRAHNGDVLSLSFSADETSCYSLGSDSKMCAWSLMKTGNEVWELPLPATPGPTTCGLSRPLPGSLFSLDPEGKYMMCAVSNHANIYKLLPSSPPPTSPLLSVGHHSSPSSVLCVDWSSALDCTCCVTAATDSTVCVTTLLVEK